MKIIARGPYITKNMHSLCDREKKLELTCNLQ